MSLRPEPGCTIKLEGKKSLQPLMDKFLKADSISQVICLFPLVPQIVPFCSIKETSIQTLPRWLFWDISQLSSRSVSFPNKLAFLASASHLLDLLACCAASKVELGLINRQVWVKFYLGQMRSIAWETASQIALRNCSKKVRGEVGMYMILVKRTRAIKHAFWQKVAASHEEQLSLLVILVLF